MPIPCLRGLGNHLRGLCIQNPCSNIYDERIRMKQQKDKVVMKNQKIWVITGVSRGLG